MNVSESLFFSYVADILPDVETGVMDGVLDWLLLDGFFLYTYWGFVRLSTYKMVFRLVCLSKKL